jgi:hypothetical protein
MKKSLTLVAVVALALTFGAMAEEAEVTLSDIFSAPAPVAPAPVEAEDLGEVLSVELIFDEEHPERVRGEVVNLSSGCTATVNCFHGGSVSCSSPTGSCTVSYAQCGWVQCGSDPAVRCAGSCVTDIHCASFCNWNPEAFCAFDKCCECS